MIIAAMTLEFKQKKKNINIVETSVSENYDESNESIVDYKTIENRYYYSTRIRSAIDTNK